MFIKKNTWGDHSIYTYDVNKVSFIQYFNKLYNEQNLDSLELNHNDYLNIKMIILY